MLETQEILKFLASFSIIIIFIYSIYYFFSKLNFPKTKGKSIQIIETHFFSRNRGFVLVRVKNSLFFLSIDEKGISKIKEWREEEKSE